MPSRPTSSARRGPRLARRAGRRSCGRWARHLALCPVRVPCPEPAPPAPARRAPARRAAPGPAIASAIAFDPRPSAQASGAPYRLPAPPRLALGGHLLELALRGRLVLAPAQDASAVPDPARAHMVESHLDDQLGAKLDPLKLLLALPPAGVSVASLAGLIRTQLLHKLPLFGCAQP